MHLVINSLDDFDSLGALNQPVEPRAVTEVSLVNLPTLSQVPTWVYSFPNLKALSILNVPISNLSDFHFENISNSLEVLSVSMTNITTIPPEIKRFKKLRECILNDNKLTLLPDDICYCSSLNLLVISQNKGLRTLPEGLGMLTNLKQLSAEHCSLNRLPDSMKDCASLSTISLGDNEFTSLPFCIPQMPLLTSLNLLHNKIPPTEIKLIHQYLDKFIPTLILDPLPGTNKDSDSDTKPAWVDYVVAK